MVLYTELKDFKVFSPLGEEKGKINGLVVDLSDWKVKNLIISPSMIKKNVMYKMSDLKEVDEGEKKIQLKDSAEEEEVPESSTMNTALVDETLLHKPVISNDHQDVGKVYDLDVPVKLDKWMVWKILIKRGIKERRLRLGTEDIKSVSENVVLEKSYSELEGEEE
jgi:sporulation protein YlmC with PRC-barrel domain